MFSFEQSSYAGTVDELMKPAAAAPFVQPWYTPIACGPADTGMPLGGLGNAFTLTPAATTPSISLLNGYHVTAPAAQPLRLRNLFFSEREPDAPLVLAKLAIFKRTSQRYRLMRPDGTPWITGEETVSEAAQRLAQMAACATLYEDNRAALERWQLSSLADAHQSSADLLIDVYGSAVGREQRFRCSLTGGVEEPAIGGQPTYRAEHMHHIGLYPMSQTAYRASSHTLRVITRSYSPVIAGDERACSLPVSVTEVSLHNPGSTPLEGTLVWTLENLCGDQVQKARPGAQDLWFELLRNADFQNGTTFTEEGVAGIVLGQDEGSSRGDFDGTMCLALTHDGSRAEVTVSAHPDFYRVNEEKVVDEFLANGRVRQLVPSNSTGRERRMGALGACVLVPPGETRTVTFCLVMDFPHIQTGKLRRIKKYVAYFADARQRAQQLALETLAKRDAYRARIASDHASLANDCGIAALLEAAPSTDAPARLLTMLANQRGMLADGMVWDVDDRCDLRECVDYPYFNSLDVYFYGSFALLRLLPRLDGVILRRFAQCVMEDDATMRRYFIFDGHPHADLPQPGLEGPRSVVGAVPHDTGSPFDVQADAYTWRNVKRWKDLCPKFVLMVLRHYRHSGDRAFLRDCWPAVAESIQYLLCMVSPGHGIPFMNGQDDTFDNLASYGISIYSGSLWAACLSAGAAIAEEIGEQGKAQIWTSLAAHAREELSSQLWSEANHGYLFFKVPGGRQCDDIFADQLLADVWTRLLDLPPISKPERLAAAVHTIMEKNFRINSPGVGAANLVRQDGAALPEFQAQDIWLGVQFSLAAAALLAGRADESWSLLEAQYANLYVKAKIPFGAPEGFNASKPAQLEYTAGRYLRPGMVWCLAYLRPDVVCAH